MNKLVYLILFLIIAILLIYEIKNLEISLSSKQTENSNLKQTEEISTNATNNETNIDSNLEKGDSISENSNCNNSSESMINESLISEGAKNSTEILNNSVFVDNKKEESKNTDRFDNVKSFAYQLQNIDLDKIRSSNYDLVVIDYSPEDRYIGFSSEQINYAKNGKLIFSYLSIGEAENYRWYWKDEWDLNNDGKRDKNAPEWLLDSNPDWPGNYIVKYWNEEWQNIVFRYLDKIIESDFDGVVLDTVDTYFYFNDEFSKEEMKKLVEKISKYAKNKKNNFKIIVNGGLEFYNDINYLNSIDGVLKESVYYFNNIPQNNDEREYILNILRNFKENGKKIYIIEYIDEKSKREEVEHMAKKENFLIFFSNKDLNTS